MDYNGVTTGSSLALVNALGELRTDVTKASQAQQRYEHRLDQLRQRLEALTEQGKTIDDRSLANAALLAVLNDQITDEIQALRERVNELEFLMSEELGRRLTAPLRETVADLGHGWQIARANRCAPEIERCAGYEEGGHEVH